MIIYYIPAGEKLQNSLVADGVIINPVTAMMTLVSADGDSADVAFDGRYSITIESEGGDEGEQAAGQGDPGSAYTMPGV